MDEERRFERQTKQVDGALRRMDIRAVARLAKVSIATVSRTMNRLPSVNPEIAKRVWQAIDELDYYPNTQARTLVSGRSCILGLIVSEITNPFFPELIQGFEEVAVEHGYEILVSSTGYDPKRMSQCVRRMLERTVDGVAVMTFGIDEPSLGQLSQRRIPLVCVDVGPEGDRVSLLQVEYDRGIRQGVEYLRMIGHTKIAFVTGPLRLHSARERLRAFRNAMESFGLALEPHWVVEGDHTLEGGIAALEGLLALGLMPTALMCSNDMTAIGVLHAAYARGLRVPDDLSVIGFDDIHMARVMTPPLTTVQMSSFDLAKASVTVLRAAIEEPDGRRDALETTITTNLIVRASTGQPPSAGR